MVKLTGGYCKCMDAQVTMCSYVSGVFLTFEIGWFWQHCFVMVMLSKLNFIFVAAASQSIVLQALTQHMTGALSNC